jgi:hypothetical protein
MAPMFTFQHVRLAATIGASAGCGTSMLCRVGVAADVAVNGWALPREVGLYAIQEGFTHRSRGLIVAVEGDPVRTAAPVAKRAQAA